MNKKNWLVLGVVLLMMGGAVTVLARLKSTQKLGLPAVKVTAQTNSPKFEVNLPEFVLDYTSERIETDTNTVNYLPPDTTFGSRRYTAADGFFVQNSVVLMGKDRTSIHTPEFCIPGGGWHIDDRSAITIPIESPRPYELPVMRWTLTREIQTESGERQTIRGFYVFWFVADGEQTLVHRDIMWRMALRLLKTGVLQRWAYVQYFAVCVPGQEEPTFERMKKVITASVPQYQQAPAAGPE
jgi:hypothetical protein